MRSPSTSHADTAGPVFLTFEVLWETRTVRFFSAVQEMLEVNFWDGVGVDASVDEAASIEAISERRVIIEASLVRRAASPRTCFRHAPLERLVIPGEEDRVGIDPNAAVGLIVRRRFCG